MSNKYVLNQDGEPVPEEDLLTWARWFETADRGVALDLVETPTGSVRVSTVFLGLDHSFGRGEPLLFETMIFGGDFDDYCARYATRDEAQRGHLEAVERVKRGHE